MVREELAKYQTHKPCPACGGTRLNKSARNVLINDIALSDITAMTVIKAQSHYLKHSELEGARGKIAVKILKEVQ